MYVEKVVLHNICRHRHTEHTLKRGLIGIVGPNGAGKSTMVNGIYASLTNDWSRFTGVKMDVINDLVREDSKEPSYIETLAIHGGVPFFIRRSLRPNKSELKVGDEKPIVKATEIEERIRRDLVDMRLISGYAFVDQGKMFDILDMTPAVRAEAFKYLCRTQKADVICEAASRMLDDNELSGEITDNSDELVTRIGTNEAAIRVIEAERTEEEKKLLSEKSQTSAKKILHRHERLTEVDEDIQTATDLLSRLVPAANKRKRVQSIIDKRAKETKTKAQGLKAAAVAAEAALKSWGTYQKRAQRKLDLQVSLAGIHAEPKRHPEPDKPEYYDDKARYAGFITNAIRDKTQATQVIGTFEKTQKGNCPTCLQAIDAAFVARMRKQLKTAQAVLNDLEPKVEAIDDYDESKAAWDKWHAGYLARLIAVEDELKEFDGLKEPEGDKDELQAEIDAFSTAEEAADAARTEATENAEKFTKLQARVKATEERLVTLAERKKQCTIEPALLAKVQARMAEHEEARVHVANLAGQQQQLQESIANDKTALSSLRVQVKRRKKLKRAMETLSAARDVFHWSRLPNRVARGNLLSMEDAVNGALGFNVHQPGHPACPAERLSWGQKGTFAVAFRYSVSSLFNADIGMMVLDEPTAWMDDSNVSYFAEALQKLAAEVRGKRQLIVITHHEQLLPVFDQVIEVAA